MINANDDSGEVGSGQSPRGDRFAMQTAGDTECGGELEAVLEIIRIL